jgi:hypothetical protein
MPGHSMWGLHFWPGAQCRSEWNLGGNRRFVWGNEEFNFYIPGNVDVFNKRAGGKRAVSGRALRASRIQGSENEADVADVAMEGGEGRGEEEEGMIPDPVTDAEDGEP